ncbi:MAG TPA: amino acid permease, partial [Ktedonobacterales bacterium]|nr:amino acid permease [Ktedonobacterales bacterium]
GIIVLSVLSGTLMVIFHGNTSALINLYALGVFTAFTLSQTGLVVHWWRLRASAGARWRQSMVINLIGALATGIVAIVIMLAKFQHGAWIVVVLVPIFVLLFKAISRHYASARRQVAELQVSDLRPKRQLMVVPIAQLDHIALRSIAYARALADEVIVVHVATDAQTGTELRHAWSALNAEQEPDGNTGDQARRGRESAPPKLVVIESPYRALTPPLVAYVDALRDFHPDALITVVLPEFVPAHWWERALHNQTAFRLKLAFYSQRDVAVANVPYHLH